MAVSITRSNPPTVRQPTGYTHAIEVRNARTWLVISGQVGMALDGTIPETGGGQIDSGAGQFARGAGGERHDGGEHRQNSRCF